MAHSNPSVASSPVVAHRYKVIDGTLYRREAEPYAYDSRVHVLGQHIEAVALPRYAWGEVGALEAAALEDARKAAGHIWVDGDWQEAVVPESDLLDRVAQNKERSARRAKTQVRRLCKAKGLATMLTLTYRENMTDRGRMARDFDVFMKRLRRVVPDFQYVCVFEQQKRGCWHAHIACPRVLSHYVQKNALVRSYDLLRSMWRGVVGVDNGNIDVSRNKRMGRSAAKLAAYIAKYVSKSFGDVSGGDSYRASGRALPRPVVVRLETAQLTEAISHLIGLLSEDFAGRSDFHHAFLDGGGYFVSLSP